MSHANAIGHMRPSTNPQPLKSNRQTLAFAKPRQSSVVLHGGMQSLSAKNSIGQKVSMMPGSQPVRQTIAPMHQREGRQHQGLGGIDAVDFSKPERFVREILDFLQKVTITSDINCQKAYKNLSGADASALIFNLLKQIAPNYQIQPRFEVHEI